MKMGSGILVQEVWTELRKKTVDEFTSTLKSMAGPHGFKPKQIADMSAEFSDGMSIALRHLRDMGCIVLVTKADIEKLEE